MSLHTRTEFGARDIGIEGFEEEENCEDYRFWDQISDCSDQVRHTRAYTRAVSYTHLRAHETFENLV